VKQSLLHIAAVCQFGIIGKIMMQPAPCGLRAVAAQLMPSGSFVTYCSLAVWACHGALFNTGATSYNDWISMPKFVGGAGCSWSWSCTDAQVAMHPRERSERLGSETFGRCCRAAIDNL
jgi:hypothetical protein